MCYYRIRQNSVFPAGHKPAWRAAAKHKPGLFPDKNKEDAMKILCFGSLNLDKVYSVDHFARAGETLLSARLESFCGGKGLNQSVALARAGGAVYHAGCVGAADGGMLLDMLRSSGVNITLVRQLECPSGHAIIQVNGDGQNCILLYGGANQQVTPSQIDDTLARFEAGDILVLQNEISSLPYLIEAAGKKGMIIVFNPSPITADILQMPLEYISYFLLNEVEARDLCGMDIPEEDYPDALLARFPDSRIVLTLGDRGCIYRDARQRISCPACRVQVVDTTAAGDTFTGFFVAAIAAGAEVKTALEQATRAAAISVGREGAAPSIPSREEMLAF